MCTDIFSNVKTTKSTINNVLLCLFIQAVENAFVPVIKLVFCKIEVSLHVCLIKCSVDTLLSSPEFREVVDSSLLLDGLVFCSHHQSVLTDQLHCSHSIIVGQLVSEWMDGWVLW